MKDKFLNWLILVLLLLSACISEGKIEAEVTSSPVPSSTVAPTMTPIPASSTPVIPPDLEGLQIAYITEDTLYLWKNGTTQLITTQPGISSPKLSSDGEWIIYRQIIDLMRIDIVFWSVKTDGTELHKILTPPDLTALIDTELRVLINDLDWLPQTHSMIFSTLLYKDMIDGNPYEYNNDLYLLELDGRITQIAKAGLAGEFTPSPDGRYVAVTTRSQIGIWDLETNTRRTLLDFDPLRRGCDCIYFPQLQWDKGGDYLMTAIPSPNIYYPDDFRGEPEEIWRLYVNGSAELVAQVAPSTLINNVVLLSPNLERYFYYDGSTCESGLYTIQIRDLSADTVLREIPCSSRFPIWVPDGEHFLFAAEHWELGNIVDPSTKELEFLDRDNMKTHWSTDITWIDETYFLHRSRSDDQEIISLATLDGIIAQIVTTSSDASAQFDHSLFK
jgi:hypothetical protein